MTFPAAAAAVAAAGLALVEAKAVVSDPLAPPDAAPERAASDLPEAVIDWVRAQPGAYEFLYVLRAALPTPTALGAAAHVRPVPAAPLPAPASGPGATPGEAPAGPRIEALITQTLAAMERQALRDRDAVIGGEVAAATFRKDLERLAGAFTEAQAAMRAQLAAHETALRREAKLRVERERLATARRYERSVSWRIGRIATAPLRIVRALVARR